MTFSPEPVSGSSAVRGGRSCGAVCLAAATLGATGVGGRCAGPRSATVATGRRDAGRARLADLGRRPCRLVVLDARPDRHENVSRLRVGLSASVAQRARREQLQARESASRPDGRARRDQAADGDDHVHGDELRTRRARPDERPHHLAVQGRREQGRSAAARQRLGQRDARDLVRGRHGLRRDSRTARSWPSTRGPAIPCGRPTRRQPERAPKAGSSAIRTRGRSSIPHARRRGAPGRGSGRDLVFSAPNGGESPMRGHFDAYDARTGRLVWRTWTTPDPTQVPFILTWGNPAEAATGGSAAWSIPAVDNQLGRVYFGTGNEYPEFGSSAGKKLWTDSIMSVGLETGALSLVLPDGPPRGVGSRRVEPARPDRSDDRRQAHPSGLGRRQERVSLRARRAKRPAGAALPDPRGGGPERQQRSRAGTEQHLADAAGADGRRGADPPALHDRGGRSDPDPGVPDRTERDADHPDLPVRPAECRRLQPDVPVPDRRHQLEPAGVRPGRRTTCTSAPRSPRRAGRTSRRRAPTRWPSDRPGSPPGGTITALDVSTNTIDWQIRIPPPFAVPGGPDVRNGSCASGDLTTAGGLLFVAENVGLFTEGTPNPIPAVLYAIDAKTGKRLWSWTNNQGSVIRCAGDDLPRER